MVTLIPSFHLSRWTFGIGWDRFVNSADFFICIGPVQFLFRL
jgi:hypothetical protein